jgi:hypothetical protein
MALPTTAEGESWFYKVFEAESRRLHDDPWRNVYFLQLDFLGMFRPVVAHRRPHTDDMIQMCVDLGIEVPDRSPRFILGVDVSRPGSERTVIWSRRCGKTVIAEAMR